MSGAVLIPIPCLRQTAMDFGAQPAQGGLGADGGIVAGGDEKYVIYQGTYGGDLGVVESDASLLEDGADLGQETRAVEGGEAHEGAMIAGVRQKADLGDGREVLKNTRQPADALNLILGVGKNLAKGIGELPHG